jgi:hypothetical protein
LGLGVIPFGVDEHERPGDCRIFAARDQLPRGLIMIEKKRDQWSG